MAAEFQQELADALSEFQEALNEGLDAGRKELAQRLAKDLDYERPREPQVIEVLIRRDQIADGAAGLYRGSFVEAGRRAALDARRGDQGAAVDFDDRTAYAEKLRFVVAYR
ncbi:MAG TPA: hypothetical protein VHB79_08095 [Polyangiaceae bacterium]|nr:hypothetical protein [Polyangiaceae bacterium]